MSKEKKLGLEGLGVVWEKVFGLMKIITGDVDVAGKGNLQEQIDGKAAEGHTHTKEQLGIGEIDNYK